MSVSSSSWGWAEQMCCANSQRQQLKGELTWQVTVPSPHEAVHVIPLFVVTYPDLQEHSIAIARCCALVKVRALSPSTMVSQLTLAGKATQACWRTGGIEMTVVPTLGTHVTGITRDASVTALESRFANAKPRCAFDARFTVPFITVDARAGATAHADERGSQVLAVGVGGARVGAARIDVRAPAGLIVDLVARVARAGAAVHADEWGILVLALGVRGAR
eukprot:46186-Rhodomonas_salina.2